MNRARALNTLEMAFDRIMDIDPRDPVLAHLYEAIHGYNLVDAMFSSQEIIGYISSLLERNGQEHPSELAYDIFHYLIRDGQFLRHDKPAWSTAPKWANYVAMDDDGRWFWYELEPKPNSLNDGWANDGYSEFACGPVYSDWDKTVEKRS